MAENGVAPVLEENHEGLSSGSSESESDDELGLIRVMVPRSNTPSKDEPIDLQKISTQIGKILKFYEVGYL